MVAATVGPTERVDAVVIGAGFAGLYLVHRLRDELGLSVRGFETGGGVGGTWFWNRYPGARTDSLHSIYRFSFSAELAQQWSYRERYPGQPEVLDYLEWVADRLDVRREFRFDTRVVAAHHDEADGQWVITTDRGETTRASYLITAIGLLSAPNVPPLPGLESFAGQWHHSADWPPDVDLSGQRVALIGTGSTGIQMLPHLAEDAAHVTVFQRTPNYVVPAQNRELSQPERDDFRSRYREIAARIRQHPFAMPFTSRGPSALAVDESTRAEIYQEAWDKGGFHFLFESFDDLQLDEAANETACEFIRAKIREIVRDPGTAELLCPRGYPYGAKRPPAGTHYYETYNRDDVTLVDISDDPIQEITPNGLRTATRDFDADVIVFATGFDASTGAFDRIDIRGRHGRALADKWRDGPVANLGLGVQGFPNLLMVTGPLSPFANIPTCIEETGDWIVRAIGHLRKNGLTAIEATEAAEREWTRHTREVADMIMAGRGASVRTWFAGANIEGKPTAINVYFGGANNYFAACRAAAEHDYRGFDLR
jgi:cyclohexanone monooxygenase